MITILADLCLAILFVVVVTTALSTCGGPSEQDAAQATALDLNDAIADARQAHTKEKK